MRYLKTINLEINKELYNPIQVKQGDTARYLLFRLLEQGIPFSLVNKTVRAYAIKPDGKKLFNDLTIVDAELGMAELHLTTQMLSNPGWLKIEIIIYEAQDILSTNRFVIDIIQGLKDDTAIESTNEYSALTVALNKAEQYNQELLNATDGLELKYATELNIVLSKLQESFYAWNYEGESLDAKISNCILDIKNKLTEDVTAVIELPGGIFTVNNFSIIRSNLIFEGRNTTIVLDNTLQLSMINMLSTVKNIDFNNITFIGNNNYTLTEVAGNRSCININGNENISLYKCKFYGFDKYCIYAKNIGWETVHGNSLNIDKCGFYNSYCGIYLDDRAEFARINNSESICNTYGIVVKCANLQVSNTMFNDNGYGLQTLRGQGNDGHGGFSQCTFNHCTKYGVYLKDNPIGYNFSGCHIHSTSIKIENSCGNTFVNSQVRQVTINLKGGYNNVFNRCTFLEGQTIINHAVDGVADKTIFWDNYYQNGTRDSKIHYNNFMWLGAFKEKLAFNGLQTLELIPSIQNVFNQSTSCYDSTNFRIKALPVYGEYCFNIKLKISNKFSIDNLVKFSVNANTTTNIFNGSIRLFANEENRIVNFTFNIKLNASDSLIFYISSEKAINVEATDSKIYIITQ